MNLSINDGGGCRTALATPGLLNIYPFCIFVLNSLFILVVASSTVKGNDKAVLFCVLNLAVEFLTIYFLQHNKEFFGVFWFGIYC